MARELVLYDAKVWSSGASTRSAAASGTTSVVDCGHSAADIALFGYVHVAPEGGFTLDPYPAILAWMRRVRAQPGFVSMEEWSAAAAATACLRTHRPLTVPSLSVEIAPSP
jgi:glutathione S-transferase